MANEMTCKCKCAAEERQKVVAHLNMLAVLPRLEELVQYDADAQELIKGMKFSIRFRVMGGPSIFIAIGNGKITSTTDTTLSADTGLLFTSYEQANRMFAGEKVVPIPYWGAWRMSDLKRFTQLSTLLEKYLKPSDESLKDPGFKAQVVKMTLHTIAAGVAQLAEHDSKASHWAKSVPEGVAMFKVLPEGPAACISVQGGKFRPIWGEVKNPSVTTTFKDIDTALNLFTGKLDAFAALGDGDVRMSGLIPMADHLNAIIDRVGWYLK